MATERGEGAGRVGTAVAAAVLGVGALLPLRWFPWAFGPQVHPIGPDMFGYVWQSRVVGAAPFSVLGTRPGLPTISAMLAGSRVVGAAEAPLIIGLVLAVSLGLTSAVAARMAFRLPAWGLGVIAFLVALWGGVLHLTVSYLANELGLACMTLAIVILALRGRALGARTAASFAAALAAGLAHPGFIPFFLGVGGLWFIVSLPRMAARRRAGGRWWDEGAARFLGALSAATAATAAMLFGAMGLRLSDVTNIDDGVRDFGVRLDEVAVAVGLRTWGLIALAVVGVIVAWRRRDQGSGSLSRAGLAWTTMSVAGALVARVDPRIPGHRALLVVLPLPVSAGLGLVGLGAALVAAGNSAHRSGRGRSRLAASRVAAAVLVIGASALAVAPGLMRLHERGSRPASDEPARLVAAYLGTVGPDVPVVVYSSVKTTTAAQPDPGAPITFASLSWRGRQNQIRAYGPRASIARTFVVIGSLGGSAGGLTVVPLDPARSPPATAYGARSSWLEAGPALAQGAIIVAPEAYQSASTWRRIEADPARVVAPGLAVLRGPVVPPGANLAPIALSSARASWSAFLCLLVLSVLGAGFGSAGARVLGGSALEALALAPAAGVAILVLVGVGVGSTGLDPGGPAGLTLASAVGFAGYGLARVAGRGARAGG